MLTKGNFLTIIKSIITAVALIGLSLPVFEMTGDIVLPLIICVTGSFLICLCSVLFHFSERIIGNSLVILMLFWLLFAFIKEIILQIEYGWAFEWIEFFYFDKLLMLGSIWLSVSMFFCIKRLLCKESNDIEYSVFFKKASTAFLIFYIFLLVYSFVLIRLQTADYPFRFQPFVTIKEYITEYNSIPYEVFMMFFGNLLYFTPLGYIFGHILIKRKKIIRVLIIIFFPVLAFTLLEFSQYIFQNGYCEFDDMMMNSVGFWFGALLFNVSNKFAVLVSKRKYMFFWG